MSNYTAKTKHPETGKIEEAAWLDNHFGGHNYGVQFPDGKIFDADKYDWEFSEEAEIGKEELVELEKEQKKLDDWKKRFDEDLESRSKILFSSK